MITLKQYYQRLKNHDWYYPMADDMRAYRKGNAEYKELLGLSGETEEHGKLFDAFAAHHKAVIAGETSKGLPKEPS